MMRGEIADPTHQWSADNIEKLAEVLYSAFAPAFVSFTAEVGKFEARTLSYVQLPESTRDLFRDAVSLMVRRRDEWRT